MVGETKSRIRRTSTSRSRSRCSRARACGIDASVSVCNSWGLASINRGTPLQVLSFSTKRSLSRNGARRHGSRPPRCWKPCHRRFICLESLTRQTCHGLRGRARGVHGRCVQAVCNSCQRGSGWRIGDREQAQRLLDQAAARMKAASVPARGAGWKSTHAIRRNSADGNRLAEASEAFGVLIASYRSLGRCGGALIFALVGRAEIAVAERRLDSAIADATQALEVATQVQGSAPHSFYAGLAWLSVASARASQGEKALERGVWKRVQSSFTDTRRNGIRMSCGAKK